VTKPDVVRKPTTPCSTNWAIWSRSHVCFFLPELEMDGIRVCGKRSTTSPLHSHRIPRATRLTPLNLCTRDRLDIVTDARVSSSIMI
jgi:hypothetical protein